MDKKLLENFNLACAVILQMGGWILKNCWLIKSSSMFSNEMRACHLTETNVPQKNCSKLKSFKSFLFYRLSYVLKVLFHLLIVHRRNIFCKYLYCRSILQLCFIRPKSANSELRKPCFGLSQIFLLAKYLVKYLHRIS